LIAINQHNPTQTKTIVCFLSVPFPFSLFFTRLFPGLPSFVVTRSVIMLQQEESDATSTSTTPKGTTSSPRPAPFPVPVIKDSRVKQRPKCYFCRRRLETVFQICRCNKMFCSLCINVGVHKCEVLLAPDVEAPSSTLTMRNTEEEAWPQK
jgi:hypothetical protein